MTSAATYYATRRTVLLDYLAQVDVGDQNTFAEINRDIHLFTRMTPMPIYDMCCFSAIMGLVHPTWSDAEQGRLLVAHTYVLERAAAATLDPGVIGNIDRELRGLLLSRLNAKQEASAPPLTPLQKIFAKPRNARLRAGLYNSHTGDVTAMRQTYRNLGYGHRIDEFDTYPERVMDHEPLRVAWEARARELIQRGWIGDCRLNLKIFGDEFSPYFDGHDEPDSSAFRFATSLNYVSNLNISGAGQQDNASSSNTSAAQGDQSNTNSGSDSVTTTTQSEQQDDHEPSEAEIERKQAKNREKNQSRRASNKANKAEQPQDESSDESSINSFSASLAENFDIPTSETFHDSNIIPGMSTMTVSSYIRKPTKKGDAAQGDEVDEN